MNPIFNQILEEEEVVPATPEAEPDVVKEEGLEE